MTGWAEYGLTLACFVASHFLPRVGGLRDRLIRRIGGRSYFAAYGILSIGLLVWVIVAAGRAPYVELWTQLPWMRWVPNLAMPLSFVLFSCGLGIAAPGTLGARRGASFDPDAPGFAAVSRHPLFLARALWSGSHLIANGDLAHVILFGSFAVMALVAIPAFDAKARRFLGPEAAPVFAKTANLSLAPLMRSDWLDANAGQLLTRGALGLLLWIASLHLHSAVIGVSPYPV